MTGLPRGVPRHPGPLVADHAALDSAAPTLSKVRQTPSHQRKSFNDSIFPSRSEYHSANGRGPIDGRGRANIVKHPSPLASH